MPNDPHAKAVPLVDVIRGGRLESQHRGHVVLCDAHGVVGAWGDPDALIYPRSAIKMIQALPLVVSGAADALSDRRLALACASHQGAAIHTDEVAAWLAELGLSEADLRCGPQIPDDRDAKHAMIRAHGAPDQTHNNCSGKHTGFLMLAQRLGAGPDYIDPDHPVQTAVMEAFETVTGETSPGHCIDGCSAPNPACTMAGLARAMAWFATAGRRDDALSVAAQRITRAMAAHPEMVAGERRACTELMRAMDGVVIKTGAEAVFTGILPDRGLGVAIKIADGGTRGSNAAIAHVLARLGALDPAHPAAQAQIGGPMRNRRDIEVGFLRASEGFAP
jgi:L-asparaginase II